MFTLRDEPHIPFFLLSQGLFSRCSLCISLFLLPLDFQVHFLLLYTDLLELLLNESLLLR